MDNPEELLHSLDEFAKLKPKNIPRELEDYLMYVARTGDPVYQWPVVKCLFREKLLNVITEFYETTPTLDLTPSPNVDPFNYESMKNVLLERLEAFPNAPFTVQRLCELLTTPRKEYNRPDKFMRAIEKNILVVSTREPGIACRPDSALSEPIQNGVSEPPDAANNQPSSSDESISLTSDASISKESIENHVLPESLPTDESNHVESEQLKPSSEVTDDAKVNEPDENSESLVKEGTESLEGTDVSDKLTEEDINCDSAEVVKDPALDSVSSSGTPPAKSVDLPEQLIHPVQSASPALESSDVENVTVLSSSPETANLTDDVQQSVKEAPPSEKDQPIESEVKEATNVLDDAAVSCLQESCEAVAETEPMVLPDECTKLSEKTKDTPEDETNVSLPTETTVGCDEQEQIVDSTAVEAENEKVVPVSESVASDSTDLVSSEVVSEAESKPIETKNVDPVDSSQAVPVSDKSEGDSKEKVDAVKAEIDARITSTEANDEAMDVDDSSTQPSETAEADAMEVGDEDEPMEVCEENTLEEMTTSPQEPAT